MTMFNDVLKVSIENDIDGPGGVLNEYSLSNLMDELKVGWN